MQFKMIHENYNVMPCHLHTTGLCQIPQFLHGSFKILSIS